LVKPSTSAFDTTPAAIISFSTAPSTPGLSGNAHVIVPGFWIATQSTCAVPIPAR
jgi:hypothetical protein